MKATLKTGSMVRKVRRIHFVGIGGAGINTISAGYEGAGGGGGAGDGSPDATVRAGGAVEEPGGRTPGNHPVAPSAPAP